MYKRALIISLIYGPRSCEAIEQARVSRTSISRGASFFNEVYNERRRPLNLSKEKKQDRIERII